VCCQAHANEELDSVVSPLQSVFLDIFLDKTLHHVPFAVKLQSISTAHAGAHQAIAIQLGRRSRRKDCETVT
jgi:hypothetical protein